MDGKQHFYNCCAVRHINCKETFQFGMQNPKRVDRWEYRCSPLNRTQSQRYAVCYFPMGDFYAAWDLEAPKARSKTVFSINKELVPAHFDHRVVFATKAVEYQNWAQEKVLLFSADGVDAFLKQVTEEIEQN